MDEWDVVVNWEEQVIQQATQDAKHDSKAAGIKDGKELGFIRAYEYAKEVAYYKGMASRLLSEFEKENIIVSERAVQVLHQIIAEADLFPRTNDETVDVLGVLQRVRNKTKLAKSLLKTYSSLFDYASISSGGLALVKEKKEMSF